MRITSPVTPPPRYIRDIRVHFHVHEWRHLHVSKNGQTGQKLVKTAKLVKNWSKRSKTGQNWSNWRVCTSGDICMSPPRCMRIYHGNVRIYLGCTEMHACICMTYIYISPPRYTRAFACARAHASAIALLPTASPLRSHWCELVRAQRRHHLQSLSRQRQETIPRTVRYHRCARTVASGCAVAMGMKMCKIPLPPPPLSCRYFPRTRASYTREIVCLQGYYLKKNQRTMIDSNLN